eukprot:7937864-Pyramimonas_sp.AAC.1
MRFLGARVADPSAEEARYPTSTISETLISARETSAILNIALASASDPMGVPTTARSPWS